MAKGKRSRRVNFKVSRRVSYNGKQYLPGSLIEGIWEEEARYMEESLEWGVVVEIKTKDHDI